MYVAYLEYKAKWHYVTSKNMANLKKRKKSMLLEYLPRKKTELELIVLQMLLIFKWNSRKEKRFRGCMIDDTVIESKEFLTAENMEINGLKVKLADV